MKKYRVALVLLVSFSLWNYKQNQHDQVLPARNDESTARVAVEGAPLKQWDLTLGSTGEDVITSAMTWWNGNLVLGGYPNSPLRVIKAITRLRAEWISGFFNSSKQDGAVVERQMPPT